MEQINVMNELIRIALNAIKKQGFSVMLLLAAIYSLVFFIQNQNQEMKTMQSSYANLSDGLRGQIDKCNSEREALAVKVTALEVRLETLIQKRLGK